MEKKTVFQLKSLYRDALRVTGFTFGSGEKSACVVGALRGNEVQQLYTCSQLVKALKEIEAQGKLVPGKSVLVVPCVNSASMNIRKRFWPTDNTDINRMFPGYSLGETTQRIAAGLFEEIKGYKNGIQFASFYVPGVFVPHVRIMKTGWENAEKAKEFGLPYILLRQPRPYDTTTLNYNWQVWESDAFSVYAGTTDTIDRNDVTLAVNAVLNFLRKENIITGTRHIHEGYISEVIDEGDLMNIQSHTSGIIDAFLSPGANVARGQTLAQVLDPYDGSVREQLTAPTDGVIFFAQEDPLTYAGSCVYKLIR